MGAWWTKQYLPSKGCTHEDRGGRCSREPNHSGNHYHVSASVAVRAAAPVTRTKERFDHAFAVWFDGGTYCKFCASEDVNAEWHTPD
jgi:hypothetical protein